MRKPHAKIFALLGLVLSLVYALEVPNCAQTVSTGPSTERLRGIELYRQKRYSEAASALKKAIEENKTDAEGWYYLGLALLQNPKALKDASKAFETAAKLRPNFSAPHIGLAYSLLLRNKTDGAAREAKAALDIESTIADAYYILGVTRLRAGARDEALKNAEAAIKLQPGLALAYLLKSQALTIFFGDVLVSEAEDSSADRKARYKQAAEALEKYLELSPNAGNKETWTEQLESLRFYVKSPRPDADKLVFSGKEVTTKVRVLSKPEPSYTDEARARGVVGTVVLRCIFTADGAVKHLLILSGLPDGLTEQAIKVARRIKFVPARKDDRPVSMYIQLEYHFNLY
jgi:TonB family protein